MNLTLRKLILIFSPVVVVTVIDLLLKKKVLEMMATHELSWVHFNVTTNKGIIDGYLSGVAGPIFQIPMVTLGFFLLAVLYFVQLFAPVKSETFRLSISLFFGGVFANVADRFLRGYVVDYLSFNIFGYWTPYLNFADLCQIIAMVLMLVGQFRPNTFDEDYWKKLWVSRQFQIRYTLQLLKIGFFLMLVFGVFSYTFVRVAFDQISSDDVIKTQLVRDFEIFFLSTAISFLLLLFLIGKSLSAYVVKPISDFEQYLRSLASGDYKVIQIDEPEFRYLEKLSDDVRDHMVELTSKASRIETRFKSMVKKRESGDEQI